MTKLDLQSTRLTWVGPSPGSAKKVALLVPQYNEASNCDIYSRLRYFKEISTSISDDIDLILIDDGSTDNSLEIIKSYLNENRYPFFLASVTPNSNKVGALNLTALSINHEFIILSDFDTDIIGYNIITESLASLSKDNFSMGFYFRMLPFEGSGHIFKFQQLEYSMLRCLYDFYAKDGSVPVMPGAGACYKRACLLSIYQVHSGLRNGEDREATMIGLKMGYKTCYIDRVLILTRPPLSFGSLIKQRTRWNLGYLETCFKEYRYYSTQITQVTRIGIVFLFDVGTVAVMILFPLIVITLGMVNVYLLLAILGVTYVIFILLCAVAVLVRPEEFAEMRKGMLLTVLLFPILKFSIGHVSWCKATFALIRNYWKSSRRMKSVNILSGKGNDQF